MVTRRKTENVPPARRRPPATTPEGRENQLISLAVDLVERQLREGTASSQVISHYLKMSSSREKLEQQKLALEQELVKAKVEQMASTQRIEELMGKALNAMRTYQGVETDDEEEFDD